MSEGAPRPPGARLRRRLEHEAALVLLAVQFLTRCPIPARVPCTEAGLARCARHFPLVGAGVGLFGATLALAALGAWPPSVAATLAVAGTAWLTVAFHEDGLADTFDALLGAAPREKALAIMKDSRIGSYGAAALVLVLLLRVGLLAELLARAPWAAAAAWVAAHAAGRAAAVVLLATLPDAREIGAPSPTPSPTRTPAPRAGAAWTGRARCTDTAWATAIGLLALGLAARLQRAPLAAALAAAGGLAVLLLAFRAWLLHRLAGRTGDTLGAAEQFAEVVVLLAFTARWTD